MAISNAVEFFRVVKHAVHMASDANDFIFFLGYQGVLIPRSIRRMFAKSNIHKAWLAGFYGGGILSVMDRYDTEFIQPEDILSVEDAIFYKSI